MFQSIKIKHFCNKIVTNIHNFQSQKSFMVDAWFVLESWQNFRVFSRVKKIHCWFSLLLSTRKHYISHKYTHIEQMKWRKYLNNMNIRANQPRIRFFHQFKLNRLSAFVTWRGLTTIGISRLICSFWTVRQASFSRISHGSFIKVKFCNIRLKWHWFSKAGCWRMTKI